MPTLEPTTWVLIAGLAIGLAYGALAERSAFCVVSGVRDAIDRRPTGKAAALVAAMLAAIAGTQALIGFGLLEIGQIGYLPATASVVGVAIGGLLFGLGAVAARGCLGRLTVLAATGNLRALVVVGVAGVVAYATMRGLLAIPRGTLQAIAPGAFGAQDVAARVAEAGGWASNAVRLAIAGAAGVAALALLAARGNRTRIAAGLAIGGLIVAGWAATGILGADDFDPTPLASVTFAAPLGNTVVYVMTATGMKLDFGILIVAGTLVGAGLSAAVTGNWKLQGFEGPDQMLRYLGGALLMGFGAVVALGCSIGQGLTGLSLLAPLSFVAITAIVAGLAAGFAIERRAARPASQAPVGAVSRAS